MSKITKTSEECIIGPEQGMRWLHFHIKRFMKDQTEVVWECLRKRPHGTDLYGITILAEGQKNGEDFYVIIGELRVPHQRYVLSFPGGLAQSHNPREDGLRELLQEAGYAPVPESQVSVSREVVNDQWKSDEMEHYMRARVDLEAKPTQDLQSSEQIELPYLVPKVGALESLSRMASEKGYLIDSRTYFYFFGLGFDRQGI